MRIPGVLRTCLRPLIAPIRAAVERRVTAMVDARVSELADQRTPELTDALLLQQDRERLARMHDLVDERSHPNTNELLQQDRERLARMLALVDEQSHPNLNELWVLLRDLNNTRLTIKFFGYELGRTLAEALPPPTGQLPRHVGLRSKPSTQEDLESDWAAYWLGELKLARIFHRKLWELAYVLQAIYENGHLHSGARGLGFGCGQEPLPSYFASHGLDITVTDLDPGESAARGWIDTDQHTSSIAMVYQGHLVSREQFDRHVSLRYVDMNAIPSDLRGYDFCWSICALEHVGSIRKGLDFIENSLQTLRPGGIAVHTTEFNFLNDEQTIDDWVTVLFQKRHFRELAERLERQGHYVAPLDFDAGDKPLDKFIDLPPYNYDWTAYQRDIWKGPIHQIKLSFDGFACTCFGIIIRKL
jgi:2-polyprenyl-3-methyl-5-hydroxy-6-metoxy-1,4-benzoquinol methylase